MKPEKQGRRYPVLEDLCKHYCVGECSLCALESHLLREAYERGFNEAREKAAKICDGYDEVTLLSTGERYLEPKSSNNINGVAYAYAIRALKPGTESK